MVVLGGGEMVSMMVVSDVWMMVVRCLGVAELLMGMHVCLDWM